MLREDGRSQAPITGRLCAPTDIWEPGQVFEKHIGIDHALFTTHAYLHALHGHSLPLNGVVLSRYNWDYIWAVRRSKKRLPSFRLNVFIQAKRPQYGRYAPKALKLQGLKSPYWRFEVTPHQQVALEKLQQRLNSRAIVCYACPAFHKESILHKWTVQPRIVDNSTFPDVAILNGHSAWNFSQPGARGVANVNPTASDAPSLLERIGFLIERGGQDSGSAVEELQFLSQAVKLAMESVTDEATHIQARFFEGARTLQEIASDFADGAERKAFVAYATVLHFCYLNRLNWLVAGHAG